MKKSHQYIKMTKQETLYHEDHGATLKHKCGKRIVKSSLLSFSLIFLVGFFGLFFIWASLASFIFHKVRRLIPIVRKSLLTSSFPHMGQCSNNDDHHTLFYLQLKNYNSILEQNMTLYECLQRCTGICNESRATCMKIMKMALPQIQCQLHVHAKSNMRKIMCVI